MTKYSIAAALSAGLLTGAAASAATLTTPDALFLESAQNRADGNATGDIVANNLGTISDRTLRTTGIAGRIASASDAFVFTSRSKFSIEFANLAFTTGTDIDGCEGFDKTDCSVGTQPNGSLSADFLLNGTDFLNQPVTLPGVNFTSSVAAGTSIFANVQPGTYTFTIDGDNNAVVGSAYDVLVTTQPVPLPAALPMAAAGLGLLSFVRARRKG